MHHCNFEPTTSTSGFVQQNVLFLKLFWAWLDQLWMGECRSRPVMLDCGRPWPWSPAFLLSYVLGRFRPFSSRSQPDAINYRQVQQNPYLTLRAGKAIEAMPSAPVPNWHSESRIMECGTYRVRRMHSKIAMGASAFFRRLYGKSVRRLLPEPAIALTCQQNTLFAVTMLLVSS